MRDLYYNVLAVLIAADDDVDNDEMQVSVAKLPDDNSTPVILSP